MTTDSFRLLPSDYTPPVSGGGEYLKMPKQGEPISFTFVSTLVTGYSYWTADKTCVRSRTPFTSTPGIKLNDDGTPERISHFWVGRVWDYSTDSLKLIEITQQGIRDQILSAYNMPELDIANRRCKFRVSATGSGLNTKYTVLPVPCEPVSLAALQESPLWALDLETKLFGVPVTPSTPGNTKLSQMM
jgi:hypothetical protein